MKLGTSVLAALLLAAGTNLAANAEEVLRVYGPGGPAPAVSEAAKAFGESHHIKVEVTAGPTGKWLEQAKKDADVIYSGAENMMTDFLRAMPEQIVRDTVTPLYLRPVAMLVRPGNPKSIGKFADLLQPGLKILVVTGAGQAGLWEDVAGRTGSLRTVSAFRRNIVADAASSAEAKKLWVENKDIDVWLIWNIWQVANPTLAETVPMDRGHVIYRDTGVALTRQGQEREPAKQFVAFLESPEGAKIFAKWGWLAGDR